MAKKDRPRYKVGYGKPPQKTQFKLGQSGNPKGRPPKKRSVIDDIEAELGSRITVEEGGKRRTITKGRAIVKKQTNRALTGDIKSAELLLKMRQQSAESEHQDNLGALLEEFREKNRRLSNERMPSKDPPSEQ